MSERKNRMTLGGGGEGQRQTKEKEGRLAGRLRIYLCIYVSRKRGQQSLTLLRQSTWPFFYFLILYKLWIALSIVLEWNARPWWGNLRRPDARQASQLWKTAKIHGNDARCCVIPGKSKQGWKCQQVCIIKERVVCVLHTHKLINLYLQIKLNPTRNTTHTE